MFSDAPVWRRRLRAAPLEGYSVEHVNYSILRSFDQSGSPRAARKCHLYRCVQGICAETARRVLLASAVRLPSEPQVRHSLARRLWRMLHLSLPADLLSPKVRFIQACLYDFETRRATDVSSNPTVPFLSSCAGSVPSLGRRVHNQRKRSQPNVSPGLLGDETAGR